MKYYPDEAFAIPEKRMFLINDDFPFPDTYFGSDLTDVECAYLAGLIDGEGCILIWKGKMYEKRNMRSPSYSGKISITNTKIEMIDWCKERLGGTVSTHEHYADSNTNKSYSWAVSGSKIVPFLERLMPFIIIKKNQASNAIEFYEGGTWTKGGLPEDTKMPEEELKRRESLYQWSKFLNYRGIRNDG